MRSLLDKLIILIAPIYNADGNEKINVMNRTAQNGPLGGVGVRENANGLDLNRDYMKLEPESDDGLTSWNFLDAYLGEGKVHPVYKVMGDLGAASRRLPQ